MRTHLPLFATLIPILGYAVLWAEIVTSKAVELPRACYRQAYF